MSSAMVKAWNWGISRNSPRLLLLLLLLAADDDALPVSVPAGLFFEEEEELAVLLLAAVLELEPEACSASRSCLLRSLARTDRNSSKVMSPGGAVDMTRC